MGVEKTDLTFGDESLKRLVRQKREIDAVGIGTDKNGILGKNQIYRKSKLLILLAWSSCAPHTFNSTTSFLPTSPSSLFRLQAVKESGSKVAMTSAIIRVRHFIDQIPFSLNTGLYHKQNVIPLKNKKRLTKYLFLLSLFL